MICEKCGTDRKAELFCPGCGAGTEQPPESNTQHREAALTENTAGMLCYLLGWITGIVFIIIDKRPFVRFHAMQSIVVFGALSIFTFVFNSVIDLFPYSLWRLLSGINTLISLGSILLAVLLILQAHKGKRFKLPVVGNVAERLAGKNGMF